MLVVKEVIEDDGCRVLCGRPKVPLVQWDDFSDDTLEFD